MSDRSCYGTAHRNRPVFPTTIAFVELDVTPVLRRTSPAEEGREGTEGSRFRKSPITVWPLRIHVRLTGVTPGSPTVFATRLTRTHDDRPSRPPSGKNNFLPAARPLRRGEGTTNAFPVLGNFANPRNRAARNDSGRSQAGIGRQTVLSYSPKAIPRRRDRTGEGDPDWAGWLTGILP